MNDVNLVTVAIIARNEADTIATAITSVCEDFSGRILVVDDFSDDKTAEVARAAAPTQVMVVQPNQHIGIGNARQTALDAVTTPYLCWLDADDTFLPGHIHRLLTVAQEFSADVVYEGVELVHPTGARPPQAIAPPEFLLAKHGAYRLVERNWLEGSAFPLLRTAFARRVGYDSSLKIGEDYNFIQRALMANGRFRFRKDIGYRYVHKPDSLSRNLALSEAGYRRNLTMIDDDMVQSLLPEKGFRQSQINWILVGRAAALKNHRHVLTLLETMAVNKLDKTVCSDAAGPYPFPDFYRARFHQGVAYLDQGDNRLAVHAFADANSVWQSADSFNNLGVAYLKQGQQSEAKRCFEMALRLFPDYLDASINLCGGQPARVTNLPLRPLPSRAIYAT